LFSEHTAREGMRRLPESWVRMVDGAI
jgi:hypothetical protein